MINRPKFSYLWDITIQQCMCALRPKSPLNPSSVCNDRYWYFKFRYVNLYLPSTAQLTDYNQISYLYFREGFNVVYTLSYLWFPALAVGTTVIFGLIVSLLTGRLTSRLVWHRGDSPGLSSFCSAGLLVWFDFFQPVTQPVTMVTSMP